jgi:DnaJ homolog subfamily C member 8
LQLKDIEKKDAVLTSKQQIDRVLRPGSTYFNLNPFEVLRLEPDTPVEQIKKQYKKLSILVHPDKNQDDKDRAQTAFEIINRAWKILENDVTRKKCLDVYEEAKERTDIQLAEKRKKLKKEGRDVAIPEDDPEKYKHAKYVMVMKLFADMERKRQQLDVRDQEERKRKREQEIEEEETKKAQKEFAKNFEESRQERVNSWHDFQSGKKKKKSKSSAGPSFKPPKVKAETRH